MTDLMIEAGHGYPDTARHFSRAQSYDQVGRLVSATGSPSTSSSLPYSQSYGYNELATQPHTAVLTTIRVGPRMGGLSKIIGGRT